MIKIKSLHNSLVGAEVRYIPAHAMLDGVINHEQCEFGRITSWNATYIFVDYGKNCGRGTATRPEDLEFTDGALCKEHGAVMVTA